MFSLQCCKSFAVAFVAAITLAAATNSTVDLPSITNSTKLQNAASAAASPNGTNSTKERNATSARQSNKLKSCSISSLQLWAGRERLQITPAFSPTRHSFQVELDYGAPEALWVQAEATSGCQVSREDDVASVRPGQSQTIRLIVVPSGVADVQARPVFYAVEITRHGGLETVLQDLSLMGTAGLTPAFTASHHEYSAQVLQSSEADIVLRYVPVDSEQKVYINQFSAAEQSALDAVASAALRLVAEPARGADKQTASTTHSPTPAAARDADTQGASTTRSPTSAAKPSEERTLLAGLPGPPAAHPVSNITVGRVKDTLLDSELGKQLYLPDGVLLAVIVEPPRARDQATTGSSLSSFPAGASHMPFGAARPPRVSSGIYKVRLWMKRPPRPTEQKQGNYTNPSGELHATAAGDDQSPCQQVGSTNGASKDYIENEGSESSDGVFHVRTQPGPPGPSRVQGFTGTAVGFVRSWMQQRTVHEQHRTPVIVFSVVSLITVFCFFPISRCIIAKWCKTCLAVCVNCFERTCSDSLDDP